MFESFTRGEYVRDTKVFASQILAFGIRSISMSKEGIGRLKEKIKDSGSPEYPIMPVLAGIPVYEYDRMPPFSVLIRLHNDNYAVFNLNGMEELEKCLTNLLSTCTTWPLPGVTMTR